MFLNNLLPVSEGDMGKSIKETYPHQAGAGYEVVIAFAEEFVNGFNKVAGKEIDSTRFRRTLPFVRKGILELRLLFKALNFEKGMDETYFFKHLKPLIYSYLISEIELSRIFLNKPETAEQSDSAYYSSFTTEYQEFFTDNSFQYRYYKSQSTEFDYLLFVRQEDISLVAIDYAALTDPDFSTPFDSVFAKFIAFERVQKILKNIIGDSSNSQRVVSCVNEASDESLSWTGDAINLVEVAYGIWLTGQLNNGDATISEIIFWMERKFKLKIGRAYRRWTEISKRKLISPTKYLDQMKERINKRIEDEHDLKRNQRRF